MGLDGVELIMEIEKAFNIRIPDEQAEKILTVGDMYNAVWGHLKANQTNQCNSQILYYKLRKYFIVTFQLSKVTFNPDTPLNEIFPQVDRRKEYKKMKDSLKLELPVLVLTNGWRIFLNSVGLISILGGLLVAIILKSFFNYNIWIYLIPVAGIAITSVLSKFLNPKRTVISPLFVRDFTKNMLAKNYSTILKGSGTNRKEVENVIDQIIVDKIGVDFDELSPEKSFTDDLGVD